MTSFSENSKNDAAKIEAALATLAMFRGTSPGARAISSYATRLAQEDFRDVINAIEKFQELPREKGDPAFPEIGLLLEMARVAGIARRNAVKYGQTSESGEPRTILARWQCPDCAVTCSGYITADDRQPRRCQGIPKSGSIEFRPDGKPICGAVLVQTHRLSA